MPVSRETDRRRKAFVPSPCAPMQRKSGFRVSGAHRRVPSAPEYSSLQRAAQPEVWERFSQRASSASAEASAPRARSPVSSDDIVLGVLRSTFYVERRMSNVAQL